MERNKLWFNSRLIQNLNTCLNEDQISNSISQLSGQVKQIESVSGPSLRTIKLRNEIEKLEDKLAYCRAQANLRTKNYRDKT